MARKIVCAAAGAAVVIALPGWASAEAEPASVPVTIAEKTRLSLEGELVAFESVTLSAQGMKDVSSSTAGFGLAGSGYGLGVAYGASERFLVGARLLWANSKHTVDDLHFSTSSTTVGLRVVPELVLGSGSTRPFIGLGLGYSSSITRVEDAGSTRSSWGFVGPVAGIHAFVSDSVSLDPIVSLSYATGSERLPAIRTDLSGVVFSLGFALSGWIGSGAAEPAARAAVPEGAPEERATDGQPEPEPRTVAQTSATVALDGGARFMFKAAPDGTSDAEVAFITPEDTPELRGCTSLTLSTGRRDVALAPLRVRTVAGGSGQLLVLQANLHYRDLRAIAAAEENVRVTGCGEDFAIGLPSMSLASVRDLVAVLKKRPRPPAEPTGDAPTPATAPAP